MSNLARSLRVLVYTWLTLIGSNYAYAVEAPVRIMPLGDSITYGQAEPGAEGGYRDRLYTLLTSAGFNVDFVGTFSDVNNPGLADTNHQGAPGYRVDEVNAAVGGWLDAVDDPDVILIQIGTNDFLQVDRNETPAGVLAKLDALITNIATRRPFAKIVVSTLILSTYVPPAPNQNVNVEAKQVTYNQGIPGLVAQHVALGRQVSMVDLHPVLNSGDLYDTVHPKTTGYNKMADAWLPGVTNVIAPKGTANAPLVARAETPNDLTKLTVTFSKPVADSSTTLSNFSLSGGLSVSAATLDSAKRTVTLTTSAQTPGEIYTLTVSGVRDRTTLQTFIAPQSKAMFYPNLVSNGSFESSYTGWPTRTGNQEVKTESQFSPYTTPEGEKLLAFNTGDQSPNGVLSQSFPTTAGQAYRLTYNLGIISWQYNSTQRLDVNIQGSNSRLDTTSTVVGYGGTGSNPAVFWFPWSHDFTANTSTTTLTFTDSSVTNQSYSKDMLLDNVKIVRAGIGPYLAVTSTPNAGATISPINPNDLNGNGAGNAGLIRSYSTGANLTLTAPSTAAGRNFQKWQLNGADIPGTGPSNRTINVTLNSNTTLNAFYDPTGTILPVAVADNYTTNEDTQLIVGAPGVLLNDSDANALPLTASLGTSPTKGTLTLNSNGGFTYTPTANSNGSDSFTYRVNNGSQNSSYSTVSLTLTPVNDPPVGVNNGSVGSPYLTVAEDSGQSTAMTVLLNDSDLDGDNLTITNATSPNGTVSIVDLNKNLRFTPAANFNGPTTISYTVSDGNGGTSTATVYVAVTPVNDPPVVVNNGTAGSPYLMVAEDSGLSAAMTVLANDSDPEGDNLTMPNATSPNGTVIIVDLNKNLKFTPAANFNGPTTISYTVSDGNGGTNTATVYVTVTPVNDSPVAVNNGTVGSPYLTVAEDSGLSAVMTVLANDSDPEGDTLTITNATSPNGAVAIVDLNKNLKFTPAANFNGPTTISYTVSDGNGGIDTAIVYITVTPVNDPPVAVNNGTVGSPYLTVAEDSGLSAVMTVLANDSDPEGDTLTITNATSPNGAVAIVDLNKNLRFTPAANFNGPTTISYTVSDGNGGSASATVHLTVSSVNDVPVANGQSVLVNEDGSLAITLTGSDVENSPLTFANTNPANGTLNGTFPNMTYTPAANFSGPDSFTFSVSDGALTSSYATVSITVNPVNDAPVALGQAINTDEDTPLPITLTGSDLDGDTLTNFDVTGQTLHGTLTGTGANRIYTPDANYNGPDSFSFKVSDPTLQSIAAATISITVNPVSDAPFALAQTITTDEDTPLPITLTGSDLDGDTLTSFDVTVQPLHGTLTGTGASRTYTPATNYNGPDSFSFKVGDAALESVAAATVSITVNPVNDAPIALAHVVATDEDIPLPLTLTGSDLDGDTLTSFDVTAQPLHGTLTGTGANRTYTPNVNYNGADSFTFKVSDATLESAAAATISITVNPVNDAPIALAQVVAIDEDIPLPITLTGSDLDGDVLTNFDVTVQPLHGTLTGTGASQTYTPDVNYNGPDSFTFKVSDATLESAAAATISITVNPVNDAPIALAQVVATDEDIPLPITLTGSDLDGDILTNFDVTAQPLHGTLTGTGANRIYTPANDYNGPDSFSFKVSDATIQSIAAATVSITVNPVNDAPVALAQVVATDEDIPLPITLTGSDLDGDTLTNFDVTAQPLHGTLTGTGANRTYTPATNYNGPDSFTFKVSDVELHSVAAATVNIAVNPINDAPLATADSYATDEDTPLVIIGSGVLGNDTDPEDSTLTAVLVTDVSNGILALSADGSFTYSPAANFSGGDSFTYLANDGSLNSNIVTVSLTVNPINDPPLAVHDGSPETPFLTVAEDSGASVSIAVLANDSDVDLDTLTVATASSPDGSVTLNGDGTLSFTPAVNFFGPTTILYTISDGNGETANATAHVLVTSVNDTPVARADSYGTDEDTLLTISAPGVLTNDTDQENSTLSMELVLNVSHGVLDLASNGSFSYTPEANFNGQDSFTYRISDGDLNSDEVTVTLMVNPINDVPVALLGSITVDEDDSVNTTITGSDVEGAPLTFAIASQPAHGSVTLSGAVATYTPLPDYHGPDSFSFTASDGVATSSPATVSVVVNPLDEFTQWLEGSSHAGGPNDDPDGDSISNALEFVLGGSPGEASIGDILPTATLVTASLGENLGNEDYLLYTYRRSHLSQIDPTTSVEVEWASNLAGPWITADGDHGEVISNVPGESVDTVKVYIPRPDGDVPLFTRLKVVLNLPPASIPPPDE